MKPLVRRRFLSLMPLALIGCVVATPACSSKKIVERPTFPIKGQVLFEGQPLRDALVVFHPPASGDSQPLRSMARTDANGYFEMSTYKEKDGVPAGSYLVSVVKQDEDTGIHLIPPMYADSASSGLRIEVREGSNEPQTFRLRRQ